jgi:hypothetical protein
MLHNKTSFYMEPRYHNNAYCFGKQSGCGTKQTGGKNNLLIKTEEVQSE